MWRPDDPPVSVPPSGWRGEGRESRRRKEEPGRRHLVVPSTGHHRRVRKRSVRSLRCGSLAGERWGLQVGRCEHGACVSQGRGGTRSPLTLGVLESATSLLLLLPLMVGAPGGSEKVVCCGLSYLSRVRLFATPWNVALPGFSRGFSGVGGHALLQGIFLTQGSTLGLLPGQATSITVAPPGKPFGCGAPRQTA